MFDHIGFGVTDYAASKAFFLASLQPLGLGIVMEGEHGLGIGPKGKPALWIYQTKSTDAPTPMHLAFTAATRKEVQAFYEAALQAGGKDNGGPGLRPIYHPDYYGAYVIGPDGHNVEAVCHQPEA
jgi:catechol 2,3-dioxygenase-like lactoylglutathione lyase family enzyme